MTFMKINWKRRISFFNSIRSFRWPRRLRPWRTLRWGQRQPLEDAFFHPRKWFPLTSSSLREFPYLSALQVWNIEFETLKIYFISNSNYSGYSRQKNQVQTRKNFKLENVKNQAQINKGSVSCTELNYGWFYKIRSRIS